MNSHCIKTPAYNNTPQQLQPIMSTWPLNYDYYSPNLLPLRAPPTADRCLFRNSGTCLFIHMKVFITYHIYASTLYTFYLSAFTFLNDTLRDRGDLSFRDAATMHFTYSMGNTMEQTGLILPRLDRSHPSRQDAMKLYKPTIHTLLLSLSNHVNRSSWCQKKLLDSPISTITPPSPGKLLMGMLYQTTHTQQPQIHIFIPDTAVSMMSVVEVTGKRSH